MPTYSYKASASVTLGVEALGAVVLVALVRMWLSVGPSLGSTARIVLSGAVALGAGVLVTALAGEIVGTVAAVAVFAGLVARLRPRDAGRGGRAPAPGLGTFSQGRVSRRRTRGPERMTSSNVKRSNARDRITDRRSRIIAGRPRSGVPLRAQQRARVPVGGVGDDRAEVEQDVHRKVAPEHVRRRRLHECPDEVALGVVDAEVAARVAAHASDVRDPRFRYVEAPSTGDLEAQVEVDVLEVTEVALVEGADADQPVAPIERRGTGGPEDLAGSAGGGGGRIATAGPRCPVDVVDVAGGVEPARPIGSLDRARERREPGMLLGRVEQRLSQSGSAQASGFRRATSSQSSSMWIPMLLAAAKPTFSFRRNSATSGYVASTSSAEPSELALSITRTRSGGRDWRQGRADRAEQQLADVEAHDDDTDPLRAHHR